jgi:CRP/FNR family transcriptional regulator, cyclic AMP receptor protein
MAKEAKPKFDPEAFLAKAEGGVTIAKYGKGQVVFAQGDAVDSVFYIREGRVKISVVSAQGKEAVVAFLKVGDFIGEGCCLTGRARRVATARALEDSVITRVDKSTMVRMLHDEADFSELFTAHLLARTVRVEEDLVDQLFNSSEKRLARALLLLANFGKEGKQETVIAKVRPRDACGHDRHDALPREPLYEQVSSVGLHRLQRKPRGPHLIVGCCSARKAANKNA